MIYESRTDDDVEGAQAAIDVVRVVVYELHVKPKKVRQILRLPKVLGVQFHSHDTLGAPAFGHEAVVSGVAPHVQDGLAGEIVREPDAVEAGQDGVTVMDRLDLEPIGEVEGMVPGA